MKKLMLCGCMVLSVLMVMSCSDGFLKPYPDHDEVLFGSWSNYSTETMEGDLYFFYKDFTFKNIEYKGWKDKAAFEYYEPDVTEGTWSTKDGKLRLSTELFDKNYEITMRDSNEMYLLIGKEEYVKI